MVNSFCTRFFGRKNTMEIEIAWKIAFEFGRLILALLAVQFSVYIVIKYFSKFSR